MPTEALRSLIRLENELICRKLFQRSRVLDAIARLASEDDVLGLVTATASERDDVLTLRRD
jgi:hypothetical protein